MDRNTFISNVNNKLKRNNVITIPMMSNQELPERWWKAQRNIV
jgi:hypothetical protein